MGDAWVHDGGLGDERSSRGLSRSTGPRKCMVWLQAMTRQRALCWRRLACHRFPCCLDLEHVVYYVVSDTE